MSLYTELKRRNVFRVAAAYVVVGWLILQLAEIVLGFVGAPDWVGKAIVALLVLGFVPALAVAWIFEVTDNGIVRDDGNGNGNGNGHDNGNGHRAKRLDIVTLVAVVIVAIMVFWQHLTPTPEGAEPTTTVAEETGATVAPVATVAIEVPPNSIAVLPFSNRSAEDDTQYFVDGVHDDLLTQLARIGDLKVISRTSVMEYRDTTKNMRTIGAELGVATILEGAVQRSGSRVRITAQLIDTETDQHLWADSFDRELTAANVFDIQTDIARAITRALVSTLTPDQVSEIATNAAPTQDQAAYDLFLRARALSSTGAPTDESLALFRQAIDSDPGFALAMGELGYEYTNRYWYVSRDPADRDEGRRWIDRALALAPDEPRLHFILADHLYHGHLQYEAALRELEIAQQGLPNGVEIYNLRGWILRRQGDLAAAIRSFERAISLDPLNTGAINDLAWSHMVLGQFTEVQRWLARFELMPNRTLLEEAYGQSIHMDYAGDLEPLKRLLETVDIEEAIRAGTFVGFEYPLVFEISYLERSYGDAAAMIDLLHEGGIVDQTLIRPKPLMQALLARAQDDQEAAVHGAELALAEIDAFLVRLPEDPRGLAARAMALAILGEEAETKRLVRAAFDAAPIAPDPIMAPQFQIQGLYALAMVADSEELVAMMSEYLSQAFRPAHFDRIALDPVFDAHREDPAFRELARAYSLRPEDWQ
jgi:TolB-like protein